MARCSGGGRMRDFLCIMCMVFITACMASVTLFYGVALFTGYERPHNKCKTTRLGKMMGTKYVCELGKYLGERSDD